MFSSTRIQCKMISPGMLFLIGLVGILLVDMTPLRAQFPYDELNQAADYFYEDQFIPAINTLEMFIDSAEINFYEEALAYQYLAFSYYSLEDGKASTIIRQTLGKNIHTEPDTNYFEPEYVKFYRFQKRQIVGEVRINSNPVGAEVFINDNFAGTTPLDTLLLADAYDLRLERDGFQIKQQRIKVNGGMVINDLVFDLAPESKSLKWYIGGVAAAGVGIFLLSRNSDDATSVEFPDLPAPDPAPVQP